MTVALELSDRHSVLEIGTGSGYQAAVLSRLCAARHDGRPLPHARQIGAERRWQSLGIRNISAVVADGTLGWPPRRHSTASW